MEHPAYSQLRPVTPHAGVVLAPNPSYTALEGTNSWIIHGENDRVCVVIDPGPEDEGHLNVLHNKATNIAGQEVSIALILLTHRHGDHAAGAYRFRQITGAPVRAMDPQWCYGAEQLQPGEVIRLQGLTPSIEVVATPGHTADSVCFFVHSTAADDDSDLEAILTGDTIAGRHTTMISETDGDLGQYLDTLAMLRDRGQGIPLLPGHGPDLPNTAQVAEKYLTRRHERLQQIKDAIAQLGEDASVNDIVNTVYTDVDPVLRSAAEQSTRVTLRYLKNMQA